MPSAPSSTCQVLVGNAIPLMCIACLWALTAMAGPLAFTDVTKRSEIDFRHTDGRTGELYFTETIGSGCALFDYDNDGWLDIYFVSAGTAPDSANRLFRNDGDGTFTDVTDASDTGDVGYGTGVCVGGYDNDGWQDIYVTGFGGTTLYRNRGDGTFDDVTQDAGVHVDRWTTAAAFGDIDLDGDLDLYVTRYCRWTRDLHKVCHERGIEVYCGPEDFLGDTDVLFMNRGDGTFEDVTAASGLADFNGKGLGVLILDHDGDGDRDIYVANDGTPNLLFSNLGDGSFEEVAWLVGLDADDGGASQGSMGVDFGDYDGDGRRDLVVTNFQRQYNTLYRNDGGGFFTNVSYVAGLGRSLPDVSWGTAFFDADNDGRMDLFVANGHMQPHITVYDPTTTYAQHNRLYYNAGSSRFVDVTTEAGNGFSVRKVSRGAAFGDIDNDGDIDIVVSNANDPADVLRNDTVGGSYLSIQLVGVGGNLNGIGAEVRAFAGDVEVIGEPRSGGSYGSQSDLRVHLGLGHAAVADRLVVKWPSGVVDTLIAVRTNRTVRIMEGVGLVDGGP